MHATAYFPVAVACVKHQFHYPKNIIEKKAESRPATGECYESSITIWTISFNIILHSIYEILIDIRDKDRQERV